MSKNSLSVPEFCHAEGFSKAMFYKLLKQGLAPQIMKIGRLTRISVEAAMEWRHRMEQLTKDGNTHEKSK
jgi:predicted DNA-binding transcriptional regulator AlpA